MFPEHVSSFREELGSQTTLVDSDHFVCSYVSFVSGNPSGAARSRIR